MSYCRWSDENFACDVYAYASTEGDFVVHVASKKIVSELPPMSLDFSDPNWPVLWNKHMEIVREAERAPIGLPCDGQSFFENTAGDLYRRMEKLRDMGYRIPEWAFENISEDF